MKKILIVAICFVTSLIFSQNKWDMKIYPNDSSVIQKDLDNQIELNYEPVGIEVIETEVGTGILIMYEKVEDSDFVGCKIKFFYDNNSNTSDEITKEVNNGYLPMDFSHTSEGMLMLFVKYKNAEITEWVYDEAKPTYEDIGNLLKKHISSNKEYVPTGISAWVDQNDSENNFYSLIFLKVPELQVDDYNVFTFQGIENFEQGIYQLDELGWSICGFSLYGEEWDVVVVKTSGGFAEVISEKEVVNKEEENLHGIQNRVDDTYDFYVVESKPELLPGQAEKMTAYIKDNYPLLAKKDGVSGKVILKFVCLKNGDTSQLEVSQEEPKNYGFGEVGIQAIKNLKFKPGKHQGESVNVRMSQRITFNSTQKQEIEENKSEVKVNAVNSTSAPNNESMIFVKGGSFTIGNDNSEKNERPAHHVNLDDFYISKYEVKLSDFLDVFGIDYNDNDAIRFLKYDNSKSEGIQDVSTNLDKDKSLLNKAMYSVSWEEAIDYCNRRSEKEGYEKCYKIIDKDVYCDFTANGYRLPTEAEWEYAAKGGNKSKSYMYSGSNDFGAVAWTKQNSNQIQEPGKLSANEIGIYDMSGNVREWCWDSYDDDYYKDNVIDNPTGPNKNKKNRVVRGGSYNDMPRRCTVTYRRFNPLFDHDKDLGFRIVRNSK